MAAIKLRGHHLVCLHFFDGADLGSGFEEKIRELRLRGQTGEMVEVVVGPDEECLVCPELGENHECKYKAGANDEIMALDALALSGLGVRPGDRFSWAMLTKMVSSVSEKWFNGFCCGCDYIKGCNRSRT